MRSDGASSPGTPSRLSAVVFAYQEIGYVCLQELLASGDVVTAVFTHEDDPAEERWFRSVRELAERHRIPVFTPADPNIPECIGRVRRMAPDFLFSFYYRRLLSAELLAIPRLAALNLHGSLLPRYRGRCPVNWVLVHGETETGVTLHHMDVKPDHGDIVAQEGVPIEQSDTALTLSRKLTEAAGHLMRKTYPLLRVGRAPRRPQDHRSASYFGGRRPEDGRIDWRRDADSIRNLVRAVTHPYPGAFGLWGERKLFVWEAVREPSTADVAQPGQVVALGDGLSVATGGGALRITRAQVEGDCERPGADCARLHGIEPGAFLR
jgi:methionyl-tRNA formyltransferase